MPPLTFELAGADDIKRVVDLVQGAYRGEHSRRGWTTEADLLDGQRIDAPMLAEVVRDPDAVVVMALSGDQLVGCCEVHGRTNSSNGSAPIARFGMFAVEPDQQATGVGTQVLAEAERIAGQEWGLGRMELTVIDARDELIAWYRKRGYEPTGETRPFPQDEERFGMPRRPLRFMVMDKALHPAPQTPAT
jgi:GNAT superfamily N-acetyltransferase